MFTENTVWKAVERLINANVDLDSDGLSPYESGYVNGYNDALVNLLNALNIDHPPYSAGERRRMQPVREDSSPQGPDGRGGHHHR